MTPSILAISIAGHTESRYVIRRASELAVMHGALLQVATWDDDASGTRLEVEPDVVDALDERLPRHQVRFSREVGNEIVD